MKTLEEIIRGVNGIADVGIVNAKTDTQLLRDAAMLIDFQQAKIEAMEEKIYGLEERIAIMEDGNQITIAPGENVNLMPMLEDIQRKTSGLIEEE